MKRVVIIIVLGICLLAGLAVPGMTPDSPFYFLDGWSKSISMFFTFGDEAKAEKSLEFAGERLSEALLMQSQENYDRIQKAVDGYRHFMDDVDFRLRNKITQEASQEFLEDTAVTARKYAAALMELYGSPSAKIRGLQNVRNLTAEVQFRALLTLKETGLERALELTTESVGYLLEKASEVSSLNQRETAVDGLDLLVSLENRLFDDAARGLLDSNRFLQDYVLSVEERLERLSGLYSKVEVSQQPAVISMVADSYNSYQLAAYYLETSGELITSVPDENTVKRKVSVEIRDHLGWNLSENEEESSTGG